MSELKQKQKLVKKIVDNQAQMNELTQDKIKELAPKPTEILEAPISLKERAKLEGVPYLEPIRKSPPLGKLKPEWAAEHASDWEYVCGTYQPGLEGNRTSSTPLEFSFCKWPGDPDTYWRIPLNQKVYLPRMIARYLSGEIQSSGMESMKYHRFAHKVKSEDRQAALSETHDFVPVETIYQGRFVPAATF